MGSISSFVTSKNNTSIQNSVNSAFVGKNIKSHLERLEYFKNVPTCFSALFPGRSVNNANLLETFIYKTLALSAQTRKYEMGCVLQKRLQFVSSQNLGFKNAFRVLSLCHHMAAISHNQCAANDIKQKIEALVKQHPQEIGPFATQDFEFDWTTPSLTFIDHLERVNHQNQSMNKSATSFYETIAIVGLSLAITATAIIATRYTEVTPQEVPKREPQDSKNEGAQQDSTQGQSVEKPQEWRNERAKNEHLYLEAEESQDFPVDQSQNPVDTLHQGAGLPLNGSQNWNCINRIEKLNSPWLPIPQPQTFMDKRQYSPLNGSQSYINEMENLNSQCFLENKPEDFLDQGPCLPVNSLKNTTIEIGKQPSQCLPKDKSQDFIDKLPLNPVQYLPLTVSYLDQGSCLPGSVGYKLINNYVLEQWFKEFGNEAETSLELRNFYNEGAKRLPFLGFNDVSKGYNITNVGHATCHAREDLKHFVQGKTPLLSWVFIKLFLDKDSTCEQLEEKYNYNYTELIEKAGTPNNKVNYWVNVLDDVSSHISNQISNLRKIFYNSPAAPTLAPILNSRVTNPVNWDSETTRILSSGTKLITPISQVPIPHNSQNLKTYNPQMKEKNKRTMGREYADSVKNQLKKNRFNQVKNKIKN